VSHTCACLRSVPPNLRSLVDDAAIIIHVCVCFILFRFRTKTSRTTPIPHTVPAVFTDTTTHPATTTHNPNNTTTSTTTHTFEYSYATSYYEGYHGHVIMRQGAVLGQDVYCVQGGDTSARAYVVRTNLVHVLCRCRCVWIVIDSCILIASIHTHSAFPCN